MRVGISRRASKGCVDAMMTCADATALLEAFVDTELSQPELLEVARHAGHCERCDAAVRGILTLRQAVVADVDRLLDGVDLSGMWARVDREIRRTEGQVAWRQRGLGRRSIGPRRVALWGSVAAIAAGAALFLRAPAPGPGVQLACDLPQAAPLRVAAKRLPNHVYIDRLAGKDVALRHEPKSGTTMIWVNHEVENSGW
jgi:anti-sigma factor RsiW